MLVQVRQKFVVGFQRAESFTFGNRRDQRAEQCRLACALVATHHDRLLSLHRCLEQVCQLAREHSSRREFAQCDVRQSMLTDHDRGPVREPKSDRVQSESSPEGDRHRRMGIVEWSRRIRCLAEEADGFDELGVGVCDRRMRAPAAVPVLDHHGVVAVDLDVLRLRNFEERLQPAVAEDGVLDRVGVTRLQRQRPELFTFIGEPLCSSVNDGTDDGARPYPEVVVRHGRPALMLPVFAHARNLICSLATETHDEAPVHGMIRRIGGTAPWRGDGIGDDGELLHPVCELIEGDFEGLHIRHAPAPPLAGIGASRDARGGLSPDLALSP